MQYGSLTVKDSEVRDMARTGIYEDAVLNGKVEETHISWVILTRKYAIKIKKPVRLSFLDFSTLQLRQTLCEKELQLNSRFSDIYLAVLPVRLSEGKWIVGGADDAAIVDYCVVMQRMAVSKRMDNVLRRKNPKTESIRALAREIAAFHNRAERNFGPFELTRAQDMFNAIGTIAEFATENIGRQFGEIIHQAIDTSDAFLKRHESRIQERIDHGLKRDLHGDLHCGNIFLYSKPVLFDCIEFNDQYRQIDVLYELAFLCMDMESFRQKHLSTILLAEYRKGFPAFQKAEDHQLFKYYKSLRANIRAKVHALQWQQTENKVEASFQITETRKYLALMNHYLVSLHAP